MIEDFDARQHGVDGIFSQPVFRIGASYFILHAHLRVESSAARAPNTPTRVAVAHGVPGVPPPACHASLVSVAAGCNLFAVCVAVKAMFHLPPVCRREMSHGLSR